MKTPQEYIKSAERELAEAQDKLKEADGLEGRENFRVRHWALRCLNAARQDCFNAQSVLEKQMMEET